MHLSLRASLCASLFVAASLAPLTTVAAAVGTTAGQFEVTPSGSATYSIPITVPPGTAGMQPSLAIVYDSQGNSTLLGQGFALNSLSAITRCAAALEPDGFIDGADFDSNDRFCLDGQRLVVAAGTYGAVGAEYRTEIESFSKVVSVAGAAQDPGHFVVYTKAGLIMEYGATPDSRWEAVTVAPTPDTVQIFCEPPPDENLCYEVITPGYTPPGYGKAHSWAVSKVRDAAGNYYAVTYAEDANTGEHVPAAIQYTGNDSGLLPNADVQFVYETRPDASTRFFAGSLVTQSKRLLRLEIRLDNATVREYRFAYGGGAGPEWEYIRVCEPPPDENVCYDQPVAGYTPYGSRLSSVTECAGGECLNPTTFSWTAPGSGRYIAEADTFGASHYVAGTANGAILDLARVLFGDFNADGVADIY